MCYRNANMKAYLGETKFKMLEEFGAIREKYGAQPTKCENVFQSVCPWDSVGMSSIFMKLMVRISVVHLDVEDFSEELFRCFLAGSLWLKRAGVSTL